jgi:tRNA threonylcarbamoyladenosine biosynthesis protein TsaB
MFLAFDTSTEWCSVAVGRDGEFSFLAKRSGQEHSKQLLSMIDAVLSQQNCALEQLSAIIFGAGPGSFTGLRIACGVAQGLAYGANLPVVGVSTLEVLAQRWRSSGKLDEPTFVLFDARMGQFYGQLFDRVNSQLSSSHEWLLHPFVTDTKDLVEPVQRWFNDRNVAKSDLQLKLVGNAWAHADPHIKEVLDILGCSVNDQTRIDEQAYPRADWLLKLGQNAFERGEYCEAAQASPLYVRDNVALNKAGQQALREKNLRERA